MSKEETITLLLRLPPELHRRCQILAGKAGVSLNTFVIQTLEQFSEDLPLDAETRLTLRIERLEKAVFGKTKK